jgi:hypothetical protein
MPSPSTSPNNTFDNVVKRVEETKKELEEATRKLKLAAAQLEEELKTDITNMSEEELKQYNDKVKKLSDDINKSLAHKNKVYYFKVAFTKHQKAKGDLNQLTRSTSSKKTRGGSKRRKQKKSRRNLK